MKKKSFMCFSLLITAVLAVQSAKAVEEMGGFVDSGGGGRGGFDDGGIDPFVDSGSGFNDRRINEGFDHGRQSIESTFTRRPPGPPESRPGPESASKPTPLSSFLTFSIFGAVISYIAFSWYTHKKMSLMLVQVSIKNRTPEIQRHLSQTAKNWTMQDGNGLSPKGARGILSDTISHILLHLDRCYSAASYMEVIVDKNSWKRRFEKMCIEQREKSNGRTVEQSVGSQVDEYLVVTVLVAAFGAYKLPAVHCLADLKKAFSCLQSARDYTAAVKVFWTPPDGSSRILEEELVEEFPQLIPLESQHLHYKTSTINSRPLASVPVS